MSTLSPYLIYILSFTSALVISIMSMPRIIYVTKRKKLFDVPDHKRKVHVDIIPNLGGVGIFFAYVIVACFFLNHMLLDRWNYIIASSLLLFVTGVNDDLVGMTASKKFIAQFAAAVITVCFAHDIYINSLHGIFGIGDLPFWISIPFTTIGCVFVTNAFNLIDGIDGLAGSIGTFSTFLLGLGLAAEGNVGAACIAFCLSGSVIGFLRYNLSPAKIFMGDTGSLLLGFTISVLCMLFIHFYASTEPIAIVVHSHKAALLVALSILFIPIFDSFRVFAVRILKGGSPFKADRTHLHHYLLDAGFTHSQAVSILLMANVLILTVALLLQDINATIALISICGIALGLFAILSNMRKKRLAKNMELIAERNRIMEENKLRIIASADKNTANTILSR